jgi:hypothetical protein
MYGILTYFFVLLLTGCATSGGALFSQPPSAPADYATLVIYREKGFTGSFFEHGYYVNDQTVALLGTHNYTYLGVKAGKVRVQWSVGKSVRVDDGWSKPFEIDAVPGETYYYKEGLTTTSIIPLAVVTVYQTKTAFGFMDPNAAKQELVTYRYVKPLIEVLQ